MVQDLTVSRQELDPAYPDVFIQVEFYRHVAVIDHTRSWYRLGGHIQHDIWLAQGELWIIEFEGGKLIFALTPRRSVLDPLDQLLFFFNRKPGNVLDRHAHMGIDLAWRHAFGHDNFFHHR